MWYTLWSCWTTLSWSFPCNSNHESKSSDLLNTSGNKKFNKAQSSWRLFCNGVPVSKSLFLQLNSLTICDNAEFSFLIRWASSIIIYLHDSFLNWAFSNKQISYDVTQTSKSIFNNLSFTSLALNYELYYYF